MMICSVIALYFIDEVASRQYLYSFYFNLLYLLFFRTIDNGQTYYIAFSIEGFFMTTKDIFISLALMCLWGLNFSAIKLGAMQTDPILLTALRFTFAVFPAILFVRRPPEAARYLIAYGPIFGLGVWGMMVWSINLGMSAGMAGLLMDMSKISSMALGYFLLKEAITANKIIGAALAVGGLLVSSALSDGSVPLRALPLTLIAAFSWSLMALVVKRSKTKHVFAFSVWGMLFAPLPLVLFAYLLNGVHRLSTTLTTQLASLVFDSFSGVSNHIIGLLGME